MREYKIPTILSPLKKEGVEVSCGEGEGGRGGLFLKKATTVTTAATPAGTV